MVSKASGWSLLTTHLDCMYMYIRIYTPGLNVYTVIQTETAKKDVYGRNNYHDIPTGLSPAHMENNDPVNTIQQGWVIRTSETSHTI